MLNDLQAGEQWAQHAAFVISIIYCRGVTAGQNLLYIKAPRQLC